ncbi:MAG TPA: hypothetical protein VNO51_15935 [Ilumatobacteraceae bacterium]|nr:hypothetical protein [Ilumatobacteraceae bacterium]
MDIERQLSEHLAEAAAGVSATPDLAEVELGARRVRGRRRVATGVAAAMLIAGAGGAGFGLGREAGGSDAQVTPAQAGDTGGDEAPAATVGPADASQEVQPSETAPATPAPGAIGPPLGSPGTMSRDFKVGAAEMPPYELVVERVTDSGITIRALRGESWYSDETSMADSNGWMPPRWCHGDAELRIGLSGPGLIDVTGASWYSELEGDVAVSATQAGWADGQPFGIVVVQVADGITEVAATAGEVSDRVAPSGGAAILLLPGIDPYIDDYTVEVTDASGVRALDESELNPMNTAEWHAACEPPPPPLPAAGEQPADAAAAEAAVRDVFAELFGSSVPFEDKRDGLLDDYTGVDAAIAEARDGDFADAVATAEYTIEDFVFTSPTEAWFRYAIATGTSYFGQRYGTSQLIDGSWRISRAVICQDLALAGAPCEPDPGPIYPPSWEDTYGTPPPIGACMETEAGGEICEPAEEMNVALPTGTAPEG